MILKVCGITRLDDAMHAVQQGATALGFVFWPRSPRCIAPRDAREIVAALPGGVTAVGVFVDEPVARVRDIVRSTGLRAVQLHGDEVPEEYESFECSIVRSVTLDGADDAFRQWPSGTTWLLDTFDPIRRGGTGTPVDWTRAADLARDRPIVLAGGLTAENVDDAIRTVRPRGVDVSSGVETSPGNKDREKVALFLTNARRAYGLL